MSVWGDADSQRGRKAGASPGMLTANNNVHAPASRVLENVWWNYGIWLLKVYTSIAEVSVTVRAGLMNSGPLLCPRCGA